MTLSAQQALNQAATLHRAGRLAEAERLYRQILAINPRHADSLHLLGVIAHQRGRSDLAVDLIGKAIALNDRSANFHSTSAPHLTHSVALKMPNHITSGQSCSIPITSMLITIYAIRSSSAASLHRRRCNLGAR